ncbi:MAG: hypothetical protein K6B65_02455 [Bacilli bacterium]|nr:hypothetical protein [Bacilli bacterium]
MNKVEIEEYLSSCPYRYERDGYDAFLKKARIANPFPSIHIVGSNGKSSTAAYLSSIYVHNGYRVGLITSLYEESSLECVKYNGVGLNEGEFSSLYGEYGKLIEKYDLSRWEILCAFGFLYFKKKGVDLLILDSGLGGDIDATYIEGEDQRMVILTSLSLEHTSILGTTLSQIALNKISVLGESSLLLITHLDEDLTKLLRESAEANRSEFRVVDNFHFERPDKDGFHFTYQPFGEVVISQKARYLAYDASMALEASKLLERDFPLDREKTIEAIKDTFVPMMMEDRGKAIFDLSSNVESSEALVVALRVYGAAHIHMLFAAENTSNIASMLPFLSNYCISLTLTTLEDNPNIRKEEGYFLYTEDFKYVSDPMEAYRAIREDYPDDYIVITGSKDFVREMRKRIRE